VATLSPSRTATHAELALEPTSDELLLRQSVASISRKYCPDYFQSCPPPGTPSRAMARSLHIRIP